MNWVAMLYVQGSFCECTQPIFCNKNPWPYCWAGGILGSLEVIRSISKPATGVWPRINRPPYQGTVCVPRPTPPDTGVALSRCEETGRLPCDYPGTLEACGVSANRERKVVKVFIQA